MRKKNTTSKPAMTVRRVYFYRAEREDSLLLARDAINQAIFERAAEPHLQIHEAEDSGDDNLVGWYVDCINRLTLAEFLQRLVQGGVCNLTVELSDQGELKIFRDTASFSSFTFERYR